MEGAPDPLDPDAVPDCQECGACCFSGFDRYVPLSGADHARLTPAEQDRFTAFFGHGCAMRMVDGERCAALSLEAGRYTCAVYPRRPTPCRELERGSEHCAADRERRYARTAARLRDPAGFAADPGPAEP